jgi:pimeloyl-ACP methyl ester carboxylesterase
MTGERFIDVDGVRTRYFDKGSGEVLVLFHGSHLGTNDACESALDWELNFDRLAEWFRVIAVDKLGQGHTDNPKNGRGLYNGRDGQTRLPVSSDAGAKQRARDRPLAGRIRGWPSDP